MYYLCSENKGTDLICAFVFAYVKIRFSYTYMYIIHFYLCISCISTFLWEKKSKDDIKK